jgi:hypothetical protein
MEELGVRGGKPALPFKRMGGAPTGLSLAFKIERAMVMAASLALVRLTISEREPSGRLVLHMIG